MRSSTPTRLLAAAATLLLAGCAVYAPTVPSTPLVREGEVEISAGVRGITALEMGAAWSPRPHLLLSAESGFQSSKTTETTNGVSVNYYDYHRQGSLGVGYYRAPAAGQQGWYLAAVGGVGFAAAEQHDVKVGIVAPLIPLPYPYVAGTYEARYWRGYVQGYACRTLAPELQGGLSVRGTRVTYQRLTYEGQAISPAAQSFLEPTLFMRLGHGLMQGQFTLGLSAPLYPDRASPFASYTAPVSGLVGAALIVRPDLLGRQR